MASKENKRNRSMKSRVNVFNNLTKNSRIVNFGTDLLSNTNDFITVDSARNTPTKSDSSTTDLLIKDDSHKQQYVLACVRRNNTDNIATRFQENISHSQSAITNSTQTSNETRDNLTSRRSNRQRSPESYSRKISELDYNAKLTEDTLDDEGVFRTDGVGGKSVELSDVKPKYRLSLQETGIFKTVLSNGRPSSLPVNKSGSLKNNNARNKRAFSVLSVQDVVGKNGHSIIRTRSKSDTPHPTTSDAFNKYPREQVKKTCETMPKEVNGISTKESPKIPVNAWVEDKVGMVSVATQTEEEYTGELLYVDEIEDSVGPAVHDIDEPGLNNTAKADELLILEHHQRENVMPTEMEEVMKITSQKLSKSQIKGIKAAFAAIDLNHDGKISANELRRACKQLGILLTKDELDEIMLEADTSGNGTIEYDEFEKVIGQQLVIANYKTKQMRDAFGKFDKDGDGFITAVEIRTAFKELGVDLNDDEVNELVAEADENGDGVISFEEFVNSVCEKDW